MAAINPSVASATEDELLAELERRKVAKLPGGAKPQPRPGAIMSDSMRRLLVDNMNCIEADGYALKDAVHYFWEEGMKELYGPKVWEWYNARVKG